MKGSFLKRHMEEGLKQREGGGFVLVGPNEGPYRGVLKVYNKDNLYITELGSRFATFLIASFDCIPTNKF